MKLITLFIAAVLFSPQGFAAGKKIQFDLECQWGLEKKKEPADAPSYKVRKTAKKAASGKWENEFSLVVKSRNAKAKEYKMEHAGNGDEGYEEYSVVDPSSQLAVSYGTIQNDFSGASLGGDDVNYDCSKE